MKSFAFFLLQAAQQAAPAAADGAAPASKLGGSWSMWLMLGLIFVVMYFFMIRPQRQQQKKLQEFRSGLKKGDKIVTIGGIHGEILEVNAQDGTALVKVDGDVKLRFSIEAIQNSGAPRQQ